MTHATSGPESSQPFASYDPDSSSWRTSQGTFPWGSDEFSETWPKRGTTRNGHAYALPTSAPPTDGSASSSQQLLPTPAVNDMGRAYTLEEWDAWTARMRAKHGNGNGHGASLEIEAQRMALLLPTPTAMDSHASGGNSPSNVTLTDAVVRTQLGARTNPRFAAGSAPSGDPRHDQLSLGHEDVNDSPPPQSSG